MAAGGVTPDGFAQMGFLAAKLAVGAMLTIPADQIKRETVGGGDCGGAGCPLGYAVQTVGFW